MITALKKYCTVQIINGLVNNESPDFLWDMIYEQMDGHSKHQRIVTNALLNFKDSAI